MSGNTAVEGYPYPLTSDFADVQDAFRLATAIDSDLRAERAPMRAFMARPSFIARQTVAGGTFQIGNDTMTFGAIDWDNTGGIVLGASYWIQPFAQPPGWWLFGGTLFSVNSGAPVVGEGIAAQLQINTVDQVTNVSSATNYYQRNDESNTSGEWINIFGMGICYRGSAGIQLRLNGTTNKGIGAGSRLWGMYLGPVT